MSTELNSPPPAPPKKKSSIPLPVAVGILAVALILLFFTVLKPMLFPSDESLPTDTAFQPPTTNGPAPPSPAAPAPPPAPAPGDMPGPAPAGSPAAAPTPSAQPGAPPAPAATSAVTLVPKAGEIVVKGTIASAAAGGKKFTVLVSSVQLAGEAPVMLTPPRKKQVSIGKSTQVNGSTAGAMKPSTPVSAVGPNLGQGKPLSARSVAF